MIFQNGSKNQPWKGNANAVRQKSCSVSLASLSQSDLNLPLGHYRVPILDKTQEIALIIRTLVQAYGGNEGVESAICSFIFPLYCAFDNMHMNVAHDVRVSLVNDN